MAAAPGVAGLNSKVGPEKTVDRTFVLKAFHACAMAAPHPLSDLPCKAKSVHACVSVVAATSVLTAHGTVVHA